MADPTYWSLVLAKHKLLRLCFGHSGGESFWFSSPNSVHDDGYAFAEKVIELCRAYQNVYCEVGYMDRILETNSVENIAKRLDLELNKAVTPEQWPLGEKMMYGTDWHMIYKEPNHNEYLAQFTKLFSD